MVTKAGTTHTQWCDHDTGDTTRPNIATHIRASTGCPARSTRCAAHTVSASTAKHSTTQSTNRGVADIPNRASVPEMFWLVFSVAVPMRSVLRTVLVQYSHESPQARPNANSVTATDDATVVSSVRKSRRSRKYSRNTAGVSLRAIATPSRTPRGQGVRRGTQSAITSVIRTTLI